MTDDLTSTAGWMLLGLHVLIVLRWLYGHFEFSRGVRRGLLVPPPSDERPESPCRVTIIVAAHNEEATIESCLQRVLAQDYAPQEIIVANDRSTDATGEIVRRLAAEHPTVRCVDVTELPPGWLGKTHALSVAAEYAEGDWLVFTDSDVDWHPATLRTMLLLAERERLDFASLWSRVKVESFWERLLPPACGWVLNFWCLGTTPWRIGSTPVFANGQFLMVRREAYRRIGGHAAVPDEMAEDVALAQRAKAAGMRRYLGVGVNLVQTRMYENLGQIVAGWTRIFIGALQARWKLAATIDVIVLACFLPIIVLAVLATRLGTGGELGTIGWTWLAVCMAHLAISYGLLYRLFRQGFDGRVHLWGFPIALGMTIWLLVRCIRLMNGRGTIPWGGMRYRVHGSRAIRAEAEPASVAARR